MIDEKPGTAGLFESGALASPRGARDSSRGKKMPVGLQTPEFCEGPRRRAKELRKSFHLVLDLKLVDQNSSRLNSLPYKINYTPAVTIPSTAFSGHKRQDVDQIYHRRDRQVQSLLCESSNCATLYFLPSTAARASGMNINTQLLPRNTTEPSSLYVKFSKSSFRSCANTCAFVSTV